MRSDGRTPRGLRAPQTSSHAAGGTTRSVAPNHGRRVIKEEADPSSDIPKAKKTFQAPTPLRPADPSTSAARTDKPSNIGRNQHIQQPPPHFKKKNLRTDTQQKCAQKRAHIAKAIAYCQRAPAMAEASTCPPHMHFKGWQEKPQQKRERITMDIGGGVPRNKTLPASTAT